MSFDWAKEFHPPRLRPDGPLLERRLDLTVASTPLFCNGMEIPMNYVLQQVAEAQAAMSGVKDGRAALIRVIIEIAPYSDMLTQEEAAS